MRKVLLTLSLMLALASVLTGAEQRIGTVNLEKVFNNYYKTKIIDQDFLEQGKVYRNYIAKQAELLKKDETAWREKVDSSLNAALAPEERQKREAEAKKLESDLRRRRAELELYAEEKARNLQESAAKERQKVIEEIRAEIQRRAVIEGITLVLDSSGNTVNETSIVLYGAPEIDLTERVITELNRGAKPPEAEQAKPAEDQQKAAPSTTNNAK